VGWGVGLKTARLRATNSSSSVNCWTRYLNAVRRAEDTATDISTQFPTSVWHDRYVHMYMYMCTRTLCTYVYVYVHACVHAHARTPISQRSSLPTCGMAGTCWKMKSIFSKLYVQSIYDMYNV